MKEGSGNGASLSMGSLPVEPGGRAHLMEILRDILRKALETGMPIPRGPIG
jgi:hypothetical protein